MSESKRKGKKKNENENERVFLRATFISKRIRKGASCVCWLVGDEKEKVLKYQLLLNIMSFRHKQSEKARARCENRRSLNSNK